jgi:hypothetical protein
MTPAERKALKEKCDVKRAKEALLGSPRKVANEAQAARAVQAKPDPVCASCGQPKSAHKPPEKATQARRCLDRPGSFLHPTVFAQMAARRQARVPMERKPRLPKHSCKILVWDGEQWKGEMSVPDPKNGNGPTIRFAFEATSERACYHGLDALYRAWLKANGGEHGE